MSKWKQISTSGNPREKKKTKTKNPTHNPPGAHTQNTNFARNEEAELFL